MTPGDLVPLATVGTTMPGGMEITAREMRGQMSNGMLCSAAELGLWQDHEGILILDGAAQPGAAIGELLGVVPDVVFDLDVLPNRPGTLSILGVARDVAARLGLPLRVPDPRPAEAGEDALAIVSVDLVDPTLCGRFIVACSRMWERGETPAWMAQRLAAAGMRPISPVVDVSNYVMLELGQPNHTYDLAKVRDRRLRVRRAREGEELGDTRRGDSAGARQATGSSQTATTMRSGSRG
ncbi:MAG: phenylalanine--tRNA ligase beta subunit-related protein [Microthrixaceae bacterium]|nr:phenylalanine--tRNA ligase beta subunit-related protein [Microthrixaceae bacterium]